MYDLPNLTQEEEIREKYKGVQNAILVLQSELKALDLPLMTEMTVRFPAKTAAHEALTAFKRDIPHYNRRKDNDNTYAGTIMGIDLHIEHTSYNRPLNPRKV